MAAEEPPMVEAIIIAALLAAIAGINGGGPI